MNSIRCEGCGFLNFAADSVCKRCHAALQPPSDNPYFNSYVARMQGGYEAAPAGYGPAPYSHPYLPGPLAPLPRVSKEAGVNAALLTLLGLALAVAAGVAVFWKIGAGRSVNFAWNEYEADDGSYSIMMPKKPIRLVQDQPSMAGELKVHMMAVDMFDRGAFVVGHADYPDDYSEMTPEAMLDIAAQGAVNESEATLLGKKNISLDGHPGVELELKLDKLKEGGRNVTRIYWVAPRRIYIMFASAPPSPDMDTHLRKFLDSLKFRKK